MPPWIPWIIFHRFWIEISRNIDFELLKFGEKVSWTNPYNGFVIGDWNNNNDYVQKVFIIYRLGVKLRPDNIICGLRPWAQTTSSRRRHFARKCRWSVAAACECVEYRSPCYCWKTSWNQETYYLPGCYFVLEQEDGLFSLRIEIGVFTVSHPTTSVP